MNKGKKRNLWIILGIIFIVVIAIVLLITLNNSNNQKKDTVKIGVIVPLTGDLAYAGKAIQNGLILAQEESKNPEKFKLYFEDSQYDGSKAILAYQKLVNIDKVDLIINWGEPTSQAIAPQAAGYNVPLITASITPQITSNSKYIIRMYNDLHVQAGDMLNYFRQTNSNVSNIAVFELENSFTQSMYEGLLINKQFSQNIDLIDTFQWQSKDFKTSILKLKDKNYDALAVFLCGNQIADFYKQLKESGMNNYITFGEDCFEDLGIIAASDNTMNGVLFTAISADSEFETKYINRFDSTSGIYLAGTSYDVIKILDKDLTFPFTPDSLMSSLEVKNYSGALGTYSFVQTSTDRFYSYPTRIRLIDNNSIKTIATLD